jgi:hypothetical protein
MGVHSLLEQRLKKNPQTSKMAEMARRSVEGNLTSFNGIFSISELQPHEKALLNTILVEHAEDKENISKDLQSLINITSEVKAINNQSAILHGERIRNAQKILTNYRDGAFTSWLLAAYGNRQTPYNFLQYFEFYEALPKTLRGKLESMPRQAAYTLASRQAPTPAKLEIVQSYQGQTKAQLLEQIRETFPIAESDKRNSNPGDHLIKALSRVNSLLERKRVSLTKSQKQAINQLVDQIKQRIR